MKKNLFAILAISALVFTSCKDDKKATETNTENVEAKSDNETESNSGEATSTSNLLADVTLLNKAEKELKELPKFKGKEIKDFILKHSEIMKGGKLTFYMSAKPKK